MTSPPSRSPWTTKENPSSASSSTGTKTPEDYDEDKTWTTEQLLEEFEVLGFAMGFCVVKRKSDGQMGSLSFHHAPRVYYDWMADLPDPEAP